MMRITCALFLPTMASNNFRSLFPKVGCFTTDMIERQIDVAFGSEIWEQSENKDHLDKIEALLEIDGFKYISTSRPAKQKGVVLP